MKNRFSRLGTNQRLALLALVVGGVALMARPTPGNTARVNPMELAAELQRGMVLPPAHLADWIVKGTTDFRVIDVRDEASFAAYHVPGAENMPVANLAEPDIGRNETVVLCGDDGTRTAEAWFVLRAQGFRKVYVLAGGLDGWKRSLAGGTAGNAPATTTVDVAPPSSPAAGAPKVPAKKKKEGC